MEGEENPHGQGGASATVPRGRQVGVPGIGARDRT